MSTLDERGQTATEFLLLLGVVLVVLAATITISLTSTQTIRNSVEYAISQERDRVIGKLANT
ncbi:MAG: hypothetical protein DRO11_02495 [Methanobacteriota archaeon]|nr:MAG: hypothetical protein DRO11_02495 [Euryarchaeota archaeon]